MEPICPHGHDYSTVERDSYSKFDDPSKRYAMLFCKRCGETKEIVAQRIRGER